MPNLEPTAGEPTAGRDDQKEDVEGHGLVNEDPTAGEPTAGRTDDEDDDVEAHVLGDKVFVDRPNAS
jgi:hypothetical protein